MSAHDYTFCARAPRQVTRWNVDWCTCNNSYLFAIDDFCALFTIPKGYILFGMECLGSYVQESMKFSACLVITSCNNNCASLKILHILQQLLVSGFGLERHLLMVMSHSYQIKLIQYLFNFPIKVHFYYLQVHYDFRRCWWLSYYTIILFLVYLLSIQWGLSVPLSFRVSCSLTITSGRNQIDARIRLHWGYIEYTYKSIPLSIFICVLFISTGLFMVFR